jgi:lipoprotein-anchoring transpeptidase ErfK/SrfK
LTGVRSSLHLLRAQPKKLEPKQERADAVGATFLQQSSAYHREATLVAWKVEGLFVKTSQQIGIIATELLRKGKAAMAVRGVACIAVGFMLAGCVQSTLEPASDANLKPRDRQLLANAPYDRNTIIPEPYRRHIVDYHRKEGPGTIVVDTDARYLYYVLPSGKAIRYGVTVGEEALAWSGVARVGNMAEWPAWVPTSDIKKRLGNIPNYVSGGPHNPLGARALYLFEGNKDTLFRIHGTNQPEYIGHSISSGCIRMTNEDVIDLYNRVKIGAPVVVLAPGTGDSPTNPRVAFTGGRDS